MSRRLPGLGISTRRTGGARYAPPAVQASVQVDQPLFQPFAVHIPRDAVDACRSVSLQREVRPVQHFWRDVVEGRSETLLRVSLCSLPYPVLPPGSHLPDAEFGACVGVPDSPWLRPFPPATPQKLSLPCSPPSPVVRPHPTSSNRFVIGFGFLHSLHGSPRYDIRGSLKTSQGPGRWRADVHGFSDTAGLADISPERCLRCCLRPI